MNVPCILEEIEILVSFLAKQFLVISQCPAIHITVINIHEQKQTCSLGMKSHPNAV